MVAIAARFVAFGVRRHTIARILGKLWMGRARHDVLDREGHLVVVRQAVVDGMTAEEAWSAACLELVSDATEAACLARHRYTSSPSRMALMT